MVCAATANGGWLDLGHAAYATDTYAVTTDPADWAHYTQVLDNVDTVRIRVTPTNATTPIFVGMARADDVQRYRGGVQHVTAHAAPDYQLSYTRYEGQAPSMPPANAAPWTVKASGTAPQTLKFNAHAQRNDQVLVVMNEVGSASVSGSAQSVVTQSSLPWIGSGLLAAGLIVGIGAGAARRNA